ncbi:MAG: DNRLRE domain-containing protein [Candidatus Coatesbacteria bacterium]|nr:DNRLRE domain-containing protein [Candidatus Coatesbacteria bacterium]
MRYVLLAVVLLAGVCPASFEVTLQPDDDEGNDSWTAMSWPDWNDGDNTDFYVSDSVEDPWYAFIEFRELDDYVGQGHTVLSAELWLTVFEWVSLNYESQIWIAPVDADWEEMTITWNNQPGIYETYAVERSFEEPEYGEEYFVSFDVQDIVQAWLNEDIPQYGIRLYDGYMQAISSDSGYYVYRRPKLIFTLSGTNVINTSHGQIKALFH